MSRFREAPRKVPCPATPAQTGLLMQHQLMQGQQRVQRIMIPVLRARSRQLRKNHAETGLHTVQVVQQPLGIQGGQVVQGADATSSWLLTGNRSRTVRYHRVR